MGKSGEKKKDYAFDKLLKRCSGGNSKAQEHLFKAYYGYVMGIALRYSSNHDNASEICNDSYMKIFQKLETHQKEKEFKAWVRKIVINTAIDHFRKEKKQEFETTLEGSYYESNDATILDKLNAEEILKLINSLPMVYRYTFNLFEIEGFSHDEIAQKLGVTASTSRSNLTRAKKMLRQIILKQ